MFLPETDSSVLVANTRYADHRRMGILQFGDASEQSGQTRFLDSGMIKSVSAERVNELIGRGASANPIHAMLSIKGMTRQPSTRTPIGFAVLLMVSFPSISFNDVCVRLEC